MAGPDQLYRGRSATGNLSPEEWKKQNEIDAANMKRLAEIIDAYGWPGLRFAGAASQTAFLVLQHADHDSQRKYLPLLRAAVKRNDAPVVILHCSRTGSALPTASPSCTAASWAAIRCTSSRSRTRPTWTSAGAASAWSRWPTMQNTSG
jgi:hypothetical protein